MSVKFVSAILGPEMAAPILWAPGKMRSFCRKKTMSIKFLVLVGAPQKGPENWCRAKIVEKCRKDF